MCADVGADGGCGLNCLPGRVVGGKDALCGVLAQATAVRAHLLADRGTMGIQVAGLGEVAGPVWVCCAVYRLGKQDRGEHAIGIAAMRRTGEEVLDLVEQPVDVSTSGEPQSVVPGLLEIAGATAAWQWPGTAGS